MLKALGQHSQLEALHEPYTDLYYFGSDRRSARYGDGSLAQQNVTVEQVESDISAAHDAAQAKGRHLVVKELAFQAARYASDELLREARHIALVRPPDQVYRSLHPLKPDFSADEFGFVAVEEISQRLDGLGSSISYFADGQRLTDDPQSTLGAALATVDLRFEDACRTWNPGPVREWRPDEADSQSKWHSDLERSSGFAAPLKQFQNVESIPCQEPWFIRAKSVYEQLAGVRL